MPRLHRIKIVDTRQVRKYLDSTVLTILRWRMITTLNRKLLEKQRAIELLCFLRGTHRSLFFYNVNATVRFGNCLRWHAPLYFQGQQT